MASPLSIHVRSNVKAIVADLRGGGISREAQDRAAVRALNRAAERGRTAAARKIAERYSIKYGDVIEAIRIEHAAPGRLTVALTLRGRPLSLIRFNARQVRRGVSVNIKKARKVVAGAFIAQANNASVVFQREGKSRYPLKALKTVDLPGMFTREEVLEVLEQVANERFDAEFIRQLERVLSRNAG